MELHSRFLPFLSIYIFPLFFCNKNQLCNTNNHLVLLILLLPLLIASGPLMKITTATSTVWTSSMSNPRNQLKNPSASKSKMHVVSYGIVYFVSYTFSKYKQQSIVKKHAKNVMTADHASVVLN